MTDKVAQITFRACMTSDDGRAITGEWLLQLNDHGGAGLWHGGPAFPDHWSTYDTEELARARAVELGYEVRGVNWT